MRKRITIALAAVAAAVAIPAIVAAASSAYTLPTLKVAQAGAITKITAAAGAQEDATARAAIYAPSGTQITTNQAPGTTIGAVNAQILSYALAPGGILVPLTGEIKVVPVGTVPALTQQACIGAETPAVTWMLVLQAAGQTINLPAFVVPASVPEQGFASYKIVFCLTSPYIPPEKGGAPLGAKFVSAELSLNGVVSNVPIGVWLGIWTPYTEGTATVNLAGTVVSPAAIAPGAVNAKAKKSGLGAVIGGTVTQGGVGRGGAAVTIWGGLKKTGLKKLGTAKVSAAGLYAFKAKTGKYFQARTVAAPGTSPAVCAALAPILAAIKLPCVNGTVSGFAAKSAVVAKK